MILGLSELIVFLVLAFLLEGVLLWVAVALADGPDTKLLKCVLVGSAVFVVCAPVTAGAFYLFRPWSASTSASLWLALGLAVGLSLLLVWALAAAIYVPLVPVSIPKGMKVSVLQVLLRLFFYALIAAITAVVFAVLQILRGGGGDSQQKTHLPIQPPAHVTAGINPAARPFSSLPLTPGHRG